MTTDPFTEAEHITIPRPHVPYGPEGVPAEQADADYLREAARKLEEHYKPFGSNLRAAVVKLIRDAADAVETSRARLAGQEPTDAEVRAAAIECVKFLFFTAPERPWEDLEVVEQWEPMARIALRSARAARRDEEKR